MLKLEKERKTFCANKTRKDKVQIEISGKEWSYV